MQPDPLFETRAMLREMTRQRDVVSGDCLRFSAQLALAGQRIAELETQVAELQKQIETLKNKPAPQETTDGNRTD